LIKQNNQGLKCLLQLIASTLRIFYQSNDINQVEHSSSNVENSFVSNFKIADYFFQTAGYDVFNCVMAFGSSVSAAWHFVAFSFEVKLTVMPI